MSIFATARLPNTSPRRRFIAAGAAFACAALTTLAQSYSAQSWTHFAGTARRDSHAAQGPPSIATPTWVRSTDAMGRTITWVGQTSPVVFGERVLAIGSITVAAVTTFSLYALDRATGAILWNHAVPAPTAGSWSAPAIDPARNAAVVASGSSVRAVSLATGTLLWNTPLPRPVVNAAPAVTTDMRGRDRVFITDYDSVGTAGSLHSINASPRSAANPFDPGQIVWSVTLGATSGNSPAYQGRRVYVASVGDWGFAPGQVFCFPADAIAAPAPLWVSDNAKPEGFFGGVTVAPDANGVLSVFVASYAFYGTTDSGNLLKLDAATGAARWSADANRTSSVPIVLRDGRIVLSSGLSGFGSVPSVQIFRDTGSAGVMAWDSSLATWNDANINGVRDAGEFISVGGWTNQPALAFAAGRPVLLAGVMPAGALSTGPCTALRQIMLGDPLSTPAILPATSTQAGSSPAVVDENLYSIGVGGLAGFGPTPPRYDVNLDGRVDTEDLQAWHAGQGQRDVDRSGVVDAADAARLDSELQRAQAAP